MLTETTAPATITTQVPSITREGGRPAITRNERTLYRMVLKSVRRSVVLERWMVSQDAAELDARTLAVTEYGTTYAPAKVLLVYPVIGETNAAGVPCRLCYP